MDNLVEIINSLKPSEIQEFHYFIQRNRQKKNRKDLQLFQELQTKTAKKNTLSTNPNAYHSIRKRLYQHLSDYLLLKSVDEDQTATSRAHNLFTISKHLFERNATSSGWKLLRRAEKLGVHHELFDQLNTIYLLQIDRFDSQNEESLEDIIHRFEYNQDRLRETERVAVFQSVLKQKVLAFKHEGKEIDFGSLFGETIANYKLRRLCLESPRILFILLSTLRQWVVASKEFHKFEPIAERYYQRLSNRGNLFYNAQLLYMIAHAKYRTKKFDDSHHYLSMLRKELDRTSKPFQKSMIVRANMLDAANLVFQNRLQDSIIILENLLDQGGYTPIQKSNIIMNLGIYHFYQQNYQRSNQLLNSFEHTDTWYRKHMGIEWLLKRDLMVILLYHDMNEFDLVEVKIRSVERRYEKLFQGKVYLRAKSYLRLLKKMAMNSLNLDMEELEEQVKVSWEWIPRSEEDLQAMLFYGWLKSKIRNTTFYETVLESVVSKERTG